MKIILSSKRHHYMARVSVFLITLALIAGMGGCVLVQYNLSISSTEGGEVTTPGEGTFTYFAGTVVGLVAEAEEGYYFVNWTGDIATTACQCRSTTITMQGDYEITANFALETSENLEIRDWYDLDAIRDNLVGNHTLMNNLDSTTAGYTELAGPTANGGKGWQPIGTEDGLFTGTFDGQSYEIRNLFINRPDEGCVGLFRFVDEGGRIEDIGVVNADLTGLVGVGGLVGLNSEGTVSNSYFTGSVTGEYGVGGLLGYNAMGSVSNSYYNYDEVLINGENIITIGALFGEDFDQWLANDKFLDVNERLSQENGYYVVNNVSDFKQLLAFGQNATLKFRLKNDLDLGDEPSFYIPYLAGEFDGNGHKISNLSFNFDFASYVGLFGCLAPGGKVIQVGVENINITGAENVGGLVGDNWEGTVSDSYATGSVTGGSNVGGLVGWNYEGDVSNSHAIGSVTGLVGAGGLVGENRGTVSDSYASGNVTGHYTVGGLVGTNIFGTVSNSYSTGSVTGNGGVGGLVGANGGTVSDSYATGSVTGNASAGGLVGTGSGTVSNSFWDTETSGQITSDGGTGKTTAQMQGIATFSGAGWDITAVADADTRNPAYIWNIVNGVTYPFLSWES